MYLQAPPAHHDFVALLELHKAEESFGGLGHSARPPAERLDDDICASLLHDPAGQRALHASVMAINDATTDCQTRNHVVEAEPMGPVANRAHGAWSMPTSHVPPLTWQHAGQRPCRGMRPGTLAPCPAPQRWCPQRPWEKDSLQDGRLVRGLEMRRHRKAAFTHHIHLSKGLNPRRRGSKLV